MKKKFLIALTAVVVTAGCAHLWCNQEVKREYVSPGGTHRASVVERNCGAMTHFLTIVELHKSYLLGFSRSTQVFQADNSHKLQVAWQKENLLKIECLDCSKSEIRQTLTAALGVKIEYSFSKSKDLAGSDLPTRLP